MSKQIRDQIKKWIATDARCVRFQAEIAALQEKRRQLWERFHTRQQADHWQLYRDIRRIDDFRVAIMDRRKRMHQLARAHTATLSRQSRGLRRDLSAVETKLGQINHRLGQRRGFLRKDLALRFVQLAAREALRRAKV